MGEIAIAGPLLPDKEEPWRRFIQELAGSRAEEYEVFKRRMGICNETVYLMRTPRNLFKGALVLLHLEVEDPEQIALRLAECEDPFGVWLKSKLREFHGYDLTSSPHGTVSERIFVGE